MLYLNELRLLGTVTKIQNKDDVTAKITLNVIRKNGLESDLIPIEISSVNKNEILNNIKVNDVILIFGRVITKNGKLITIADKVLCNTYCPKQ